MNKCGGAVGRFTSAIKTEMRNEKVFFSQNVDEY